MPKKVAECRLCHSVRSIHAAGLCHPCYAFHRPFKPKVGLQKDGLDEAIRAAHAEGRSDIAIGELLGVPKSTVRIHRVRLGLPTNRTTAHTRERYRMSQLILFSRARNDGVTTAFASSCRVKAAQLGWPGFSHREARVLAQLASGPKSARQIGAALGHRWTCHSLAIVAALKRKGMVEIVGRTDVPKGKRSNIYGLTAKARQMAHSDRNGHSKPKPDTTPRIHKVSGLRL